MKYNSRELLFVILNTMILRIQTYWLIATLYTLYFNACWLPVNVLLEVKKNVLRWQRQRNSKNTARKFVDFSYMFCKLCLRYLRQKNQFYTMVDVSLKYLKFQLIPGNVKSKINKFLRLFYCKIFEISTFCSY